MKQFLKHKILEKARLLRNYIMLYGYIVSTLILWS